MTTANLDLDIAVYTIGSACDNRHWIYKGQRYDNKTQLNRQLKKDGIDSSTIETQREPEEWDKVKETLCTFYDNLESYLQCDCQGYISGKGNFRYQVATILPYKGNRDGADKPFHYDAIRQFFVDVYGAKVSSGMEADDAIGLATDPENDIIVTIDKDLDCIPGVHYNWQKGCYYVSELEADKHFFKQMLVGDKTDNILGLFGVGPESQLVKNIYQMETTKEIREYVINEYRRRFGNHWELFYNETADLVWILQRRSCPK